MSHLHNFTIFFDRFQQVYKHTKVVWRSIMLHWHGRTRANGDDNHFPWNLYGFRRSPHDEWFEWVQYGKNAQTKKMATTTTTTTTNKPTGVVVLFAYWLQVVEVNLLYVVFSYAPESTRAAKTSNWCLSHLRSSNNGSKTMTMPWLSISNEPNVLLSMARIRDFMNENLLRVLCEWAHATKYKCVYSILVYTVQSSLQPASNLKKKTIRAHFKYIYKKPTLFCSMAEWLIYTFHRQFITIKID